MAVLAPIPRARVKMAMAVNTGVLLLRSFRRQTTRFSDDNGKKADAKAAKSQKPKAKSQKPEEWCIYGEKASPLKGRATGEMQGMAASVRLSGGRARVTSEFMGG